MLYGPHGENIGLPEGGPRPSDQESDKAAAKMLNELMDAYYAFDKDEARSPEMKEGFRRGFWMGLIVGYLKIALRHGTPWKLITEVAGYMLDQPKDD